MNSSLINVLFEIRFSYLFEAGRCLSFPCDAGGQVDIDALSERARMNYLFARALVGRDYSAPTVHPTVAPTTDRSDLSQPTIVRVTPLLA